MISEHAKSRNYLRLCEKRGHFFPRPFSNDFAASGKTWEGFLLAKKSRWLPWKGAISQNAWLVTTRTFRGRGKKEKIPFPTWRENEIGLIGAFLNTNSSAFFPRILQGRFFRKGQCCEMMDAQIFPHPGLSSSGRASCLSAHCSCLQLVQIALRGGEDIEIGAS